MNTVVIQLCCEPSSMHCYIESDTRWQLVPSSAQLKTFSFQNRVRSDTTKAVRHLGNNSLSPVP